MPITKWGGCCYTAVDPGVNVTGFSVYKTAMNGTPQLIRYGSAAPPDMFESEHERTAYVVDKLGAVFNEHAPAFCYVEQPPSTLYGQKGTKDMLIARAQSVFKTVAVCFSILTYLRIRTKIIGVPILPSQWQPSKKARNNLDTKEWSLLYANRILCTDMQRPPGTLHTQADENIADAVSIGKIAYIAEVLP